MASNVPDTHKQLLEDRVASLRPDDLRWVLARYRDVESDLHPCGVRLIDRLLRQLRALHDLLEHPEQLTERQRQLAIAAMKYFLQDDDMVTDHHHSVAGLVDDALVVEAAVEELGDLVKY